MGSIETRTNNVKDSYDYIVCGGGTSGCVVAGRLAEDSNLTILVIEAGEHNENLENVHMVGGWSKNFDGPQDWNITSESRPDVNGRQVKLSRGKFLGGCSGCNGTLCIRGCRQDYDDWRLDGWSGDEFFKYMAKSETFHTKPWFKPAEKEHGYNGPLHVEPHDLAPISNLLLDSMQDKGLPLDHDMFSTGETPHGCGHVPRTVHQGLRTTGADFITKGYHRENITILTNTTVDKVLFERGSDGTLQATGVAVVSADGTKSEVHAKKEVVISGGAYCSPAILLRSGLGPADELRKHGIQQLVDLPGVGKNLMDHLIVFIFYEANKAGLTNDHLVYHGDSLASTYALWKDKKTGFLSTFPFGAFAYARLDERLKNSDLWNNAPRAPGRDPMGLTPSQPNVEFFTTECYGGPKQFDKFPINNQQAFSIIAELFSPRSKGTVTLSSADPTVNPVVDCNYLADPLDVLVLTEACKFGNEIVMEGKGTKDIVKGPWPPEEKHNTYKTREDWEQYVRNNATTCYHAAGTCAMGKADNPAAVVDEKLRVKGVRCLRVADCSIMPILNQGHTQMPAYGIGEKCADLIKETRKGMLC